MGHTSRHPAWVQCLHTSEDMSQRKSGVSSTGESSPLVAAAGAAPPSAEQPQPPADPQPTGAVTPGVDWDEHAQPGPAASFAGGAPHAHPPESGTGTAAESAAAGAEPHAHPPAAGAGDAAGGPTRGMPRLTRARPDSRACSMRSWDCSMTVSYTHLTLPTILRV